MFQNFVITKKVNFVRHLGAVKSNDPQECSKILVILPFRVILRLKAEGSYVFKKGDSSHGCRMTMLIFASSLDS